MNKYRNSKCEYQGLKFDSQKEMQRYIELSYLQKAGDITGLSCQVKFELLPKQGNLQAISYVADFVYYDEYGDKIIEDVKGFKKGQAYAVFQIKRKLLKYIHGLNIKEV